MNKILSIKNDSVTYLDRENLKFSLSEDSVIKLLGYNQFNVPQPVQESLNYLLKKIPDLIFPQGGYKILSSESVIFYKDSFSVKNTFFECGKIIASNFKGCESILILATTLGNKISDYARELMDEGEILSGFILDKIASEIVEQFADRIEIAVEKQLSELELKITNRYSPGYCGWNVSEQHKMFSLLPENFCGISLTESALMLPIKSVSAVIGIGTQAERRDYQCSICDIEFCYKRERNE
jgi:hypothetical protein